MPALSKPAFEVTFPVPKLPARSGEVQGASGNSTPPSMADISLPSAQVNATIDMRPTAPIALLSAHRARGVRLPTVLVESALTLPARPQSSSQA